MTGRTIKIIGAGSLMLVIGLSSLVFPLREGKEVASMKREVVFDMGSVKAGTVVEKEVLKWGVRDIYFISEDISDEVYGRINGKSYREGGLVPLTRLRYLKVLHYNYDHQIQVGEMIVNVQIADKMCRIFKELFEAEYEIASMRLIDDYWDGDGNTSDDLSVQANNTSAFCYRTIAGKEVLSNHAYGLAVDINPLQNPYVVYVNGVPAQYAEWSAEYIERSEKKKHLIGEGDTCLKVFEKYGFKWGGNWNTVKDYQHFEWIEERK